MTSAADVTLPLLESRRYLHGTTLFDHLRRMVPTAASLCFRISSVIHSDRIAVHTVEPGTAIPHAASLDWTTPDSAGRLVVQPREPSPQPERRPYVESLVTAEAEFVPGSVRYAGASPFSFVATLIPLFKVLLAQECKIASPGQWMFSRLDTAPVPQTFASVRLDLDRVLAGKLARAHITLDNEPMGHLYFSWTEPDRS